MTAFVDEWEECVATCTAHLRSALLILDDLAYHPQSALEDAFAYDLASRATCGALVSLDECQPLGAPAALPDIKTGTYTIDPIHS
ncbi:MAG: hypothetical protein JWM85_2424 [Acidimicrobiaceae bacterium]|nr:hypothetical protein [Acidimicrobiaceae bacterium]